MCYYFALSTTHFQKWILLTPLHTKVICYLITYSTFEMTHDVSALHTQLHSQTEEVGFGGHKDPPLFRHNATMTPLCLSRTKLLLPAIVIVLCCCWGQLVRNCQCKIHNSSQLLNRADIVQLCCVGEMVRKEENETTTKRPWTSA